MEREIDDCYFEEFFVFVFFFLLKIYRDMEWSPERSVGSSSGIFKGHLMVHLKTITYYLVQRKQIDAGARGSSVCGH